MYSTFLGGDEDSAIPPSQKMARLQKAGEGDQAASGSTT